MHDIMCNRYWSQKTLQNQKVLVQINRGTFIQNIFVIKQIGITTKLNTAHCLWSDIRKRLITHLTTYQAKPNLI